MTHFTSRHCDIGLELLNSIVNNVSYRAGT